MYSPDGQRVADMEIPDDVIDAARKVSAYLGNNSHITSICGLYIKVETILVEFKI